MTKKGISQLLMQKRSRHLIYLVVKTLRKLRQIRSPPVERRALMRLSIIIVSGRLEGDCVEVFESNVKLLQTEHSTELRAKTNLWVRVTDIM